ncbi:hypothetical protein CV770_03985 [Bradyrhizobium sp. AC87j1]|nr:hypothetical protein CV770_03985 [Bradyrhizobium sp. AC87j1]
MPAHRRRPIFGSDLRQLGGAVFVVPIRAQDGEEAFAVRHISRGGDIAFLSLPLPDRDRALAAAEVLACFTGAVVR